MWNDGNVPLKPIYVKKEFEWLNDATECVVTEPTSDSDPGLFTIKKEGAPDSTSLQFSDRYLNPYMEMEVTVKVEHRTESCKEELLICDTELTVDQNCMVESHVNLKTNFSPEELLVLRNCFVKLERMPHHDKIVKFKNYHLNLNSKLTDSSKKPRKKFEKRHLKNLTNINSHTNNKTKEKSHVSKKSLRVKGSKKIINVKEFQCSVCRKRCKSKYSLTNHEQIHTGDRPHSCSFCNKSFTKSANLKRHERIHTGEKPFSCDLCHKQFSIKTNLVAHIRIHTQEKPFTCDFCNKKFVHASDLKKHERTHTGEKPFTCDICMKQFSRKYCLVKHLKTHTKKKRCNRKKQFDQQCYPKNKLTINV